MASIKLNSAGTKVLTKGGKPTCCCCAVPPSQTKAVRDRVNLMYHSGNVQSDVFPASYLECFVPKCKVLAGSQIDDFGIIGGVTFDNNTPCSDEADGEVTTVLADTDVAVTIVANKINVAWSAESDSVCLFPTGLGDATTYCTFYFYWIPK